MKKTIRIIACVLLVTSFSGCALMRPIAPQQQRPGGAAALPSYSGLKAKIAVADFDITAAKATRDIGLGLRQLLVSALTESSRFLVVDYPAPADSPPDLIVSVTVNEFEPHTSGGSAGIGGGGGVGSGVLGGLLGANLNKAHMAMEVRIVAVSSSEVMASTRVQGQGLDMDKAVHFTVLEAVRYISQAIPQSYYKY